jgi:hypothetical protein
MDAMLRVSALKPPEPEGSLALNTKTHAGDSSKESKSIGSSSSVMAICTIILILSELKQN